MAAPAVAPQDGPRLLRRVHRGRKAHRGGAALGAQAAARAGKPARLHCEDSLRARAVSLPRVLRRGAREALPGPDARVGLSRGLPHPPDDQGRASRACHPQRHGGGAGARGVLQGRVGQGAGGDQPPLRRGARDGRPSRALQARRQGDRLATGRLHHLHGEVRHGGGGLVLSSPFLGVGQGGPAQSLRGPRPAGHAPLPAVAGGADGHGARVLVLLRAHHQRLQALPGGLLRAHAYRGGLGQPHLRLPPLWRGLGLPGGESHPWRRRQSLSRLCRDDRRGPPRDRQEAQAAQAL